MSDEIIIMAAGALICPVSITRSLMRVLNFLPRGTVDGILKFSHGKKNLFVTTQIIEIMEESEIGVAK